MFNGENTSFSTYFPFRYDGGINQDQFLNHFKDILEENQAKKS